MIIDLWVTIHDFSYVCAWMEQHKKKKKNIKKSKGICKKKKALCFILRTRIVIMHYAHARLSLKTSKAPTTPETLYQPPLMLLLPMQLTTTTTFLIQIASKTGCREKPPPPPPPIIRMSQTYNRNACKGLLVVDTLFPPIL